MNARPGGAAAVVAITGIDGAGKSTLTGLLASRLAGTGTPVRCVTTWDMLRGASYPAGACLTPDERQVRSSAVRMSGTPRLLFLLWAAVLALSDRDGGFPGAVVLLDGYWMKHAASETAYGADPSWVDAVVEGLPRADLVVHVQLDPDVAWHRKGGRPYPYECGMDWSCSRASFLKHQRGIAAVLDRWALRYAWLTVDGTTPPETIADQVARAVQALSAGSV